MKIENITILRLIHFYFFLNFSTKSFENALVEKIESSTQNKNGLVEGL